MIDARILQVLRSRFVHSLCSWEGSHFTDGLIVTLTKQCVTCFLGRKFREILMASGESFHDLFGIKGTDGH